MDNKFMKLKKWITSNGGYVSNKLSVVDSSNQRSVVVIDKVDKDETLLKVPENLRINRSKIDTVEIFENRDSTILDEEIAIIIILIYHRFILKNTSCFSPYLKTLPTMDELKYHPYFNFTEDIKPKITDINPNVSNYLEQLKNQSNNYYDMIIKLNIFDGDTLKRTMIDWAFIILKTRQWKGHGLVPLADLMQHSNISPISLTHESDTDLCVIKSPIIIETGKELFNNYGIFDDTLLYCNFGFIEGNIEKIIYGMDEFTRMLRINISANMDTTKLIGSLKNIEMEKYKIGKHFFITNKGLCIHLLEYLRIVALSDTDLKLIDLNTKYYEKVISLENEARVYIWIRSLLNSYIQQDKKNEIIQKCREIINSDSPKLLEYHAALLVLIYTDVISKTEEFLIKRWLTNIDIPKN